MQKDFFNIPPKYSADVKIYTANMGVNNQGFQIWQKPKGASFVYMVAIDGGGGGGGGFTRVAGNAGGGGAGGACSGISRFNCPSIFLPDTMYIQVGNGGQGGAASSNGSAGIKSIISAAKSVTTPNVILEGCNAAPGGGGAGTGSAGGTGGSVPTVAVTRVTHGWGEWFSIVGLVGGAGGAQTGAVGTDITAWALIPLSPGAGGAGCTTTDFAGGNQSNNSGATMDIGNQMYFTTGTGQVAKGGTAAGAGVDGSGGLQRITPFFNSGGAGGGSNNSGQAGHGGTGGYGCGGGGGGAGATGGKGGNGGSGLVVIVTI